MVFQRFAQVFLVLLVASSASPASAVTLTRPPSVWLQTPTSILIAWRTDALSTGKVLYGPTPGLGSEASHAGTSTDHPVALTGLDPGTAYYYRIVSGTDSLSDGSDSFRTAPGSTVPFRFLAFGDLGRATPEQIEIAARIDSLNADLAILTGDIIYESGEAANFTPQYFNIYRPTVARIPFYSSLGNHDVVTASGQPYLDAFYLPSNGTAGTERYYSFDYANAHFVALEVTVENATPSAAMRSWLDADLAVTTQKWKFVFFHVPMYSNLGTHGDDPTIRAALEPIFQARGVDVVFQGHNHFYTRTFPILGGAPVNTSQEPNYVNPNAPIYIVTGGAGRALYALTPLTSYEAYSASTFHTTVIDVADNALALGAVGRNGTVFDSMTLTKDGTTAVALTEYRSESDPSGVILRWRVSGGSEVVGFHVYRGPAASAVSGRLTASLLAGGPTYEYLDSTAEAGRDYYYALGAVDSRGMEERVGLVMGRRSGPFRFAAERPRPNPSDGDAEIRFTLDQNSPIRITIYNVAGRAVRVIDSPGSLGPGAHAIQWDGMDRVGRSVPAGIYFARIESLERALTARLLRLR